MKKSLPIQLTEYEVVKFWSKVTVKSVDECWPWLGTVMGGPNAAGIYYGAMRLKYTKRRHIRANRISAFLAYGPPPSDYHWALHTCNNPNCVNPTHLYWGLAENNRGDVIFEDSTLYGKNGIAHSRHIRGKLTPDQVKAIRSDSRSATKVASAYGVKKLNVLRIRRRQTWKWVD